MLGKKKKPGTAIPGFYENFRYKPEAKQKHIINYLLRLPVKSSLWLMKIFLIRICCRWCHCCFLLCRSCYRGHVYCSQACRKAGRRHSLNQAQRRYRKTQKGKKSHLESENRRRYGKKRPCVKKMDDHTSSPRLIVPSMDPYRPLLVGTCHFCGRKGWIVDAFERRKYR